MNYFYSSRTSLSYIVPRMKIPLKHLCFCKITFLISVHGNPELQTYLPGCQAHDLAKLPAVILGNMSGGSTVINVVERFFKNYEGGLPIDVKMTITDDALVFSVNTLAKLTADNVDDVAIPFYKINDVRCIEDKFMTNMNLRLYKARHVIIDTDDGEYWILDQPDIMSLYKSRAQKIADAINKARGY